jgi:TrmH family RNA methyltransferase
MITQIVSVKNQLIKEIVVLRSKSRERNKKKLIVIEGQKEVSLALISKIEIDKILYCPDIIDFGDIDNLFQDKIGSIPVFELSKEVFSKISYRESTEGIIVVAKSPQKKLSDLKVNSNSVFIILESVEKPGNLGAIARIADGAGVSGIIICDPLTDIFNPNAIRASLGCVFTTDVVVSDFEKTKEWLTQNQIKSFAAELNASNFYQDTDFSGRIALVFGTEATGLTEKWIKGADARIKIPMLGEIDSLNVSTSVAVLVYDAMRQREFLV